MAHKKHEEHTNHEAWAIPYADLMTLLLAFFVVMYAISTRNETKYRSIADALHAAFGGSARTISPIQLEQGPSNAPVPIQSGAPPPPSHHRSRDRAMQKQLNRIADDLERALGELVRANLIIVHRKEWSLEVEINSDILFATGSAVLDADARDILDKVAGVLDSAPNPLRIEGYTDDRPIRTAQFPSNWELSAARAASVVHLFADHAIAPGRLSMMGFGEYRPFADNTSEAGRNRNRRVVLVVLAGEDVPDGVSGLLADAPGREESGIPAPADMNPAAGQGSAGKTRHTAGGSP